MIIDCHGHYTTEPRQLLDFRQRQIAAFKDHAERPSPAALDISDDEIRASLEGAQLKLQRERGTDLTIFSPRASGMGHHIGDAGVSLEWSQALQRADPSRLHALSAATSSACASCRNRPASTPRPASASSTRCVTRVRLRRLQSQSRSVRRPLDRPAADRPLLVSALREDGRARRAGDDPCAALVQRELPHHRRALHQCRHHRLHAVHHRRPVQGLSRP